MSGKTDEEKIQRMLTAHEKFKKSMAELRVKRDALILDAQKRQKEEEQKKIGLKSQQPTKTSSPKTPVTVTQPLGGAITIASRIRAEESETIQSFVDKVLTILTNFGSQDVGPQGSVVINRNQLESEQESRHLSNSRIRYGIARELEKLGFYDIRFTHHNVLLLKIPIEEKENEKTAN